MYNYLFKHKLYDGVVALLLDGLPSSFYRVVVAVHKLSDREGTEIETVGLAQTEVYHNGDGERTVSERAREAAGVLMSAYVRSGCFLSEDALAQSIEATARLIVKDRAARPPLTLEQAVELLNECEYRGNTRWEVWQGEALAVGDGFRLTEFEAIAVAEKLAREVG